MKRPENVLKCRLAPNHREIRSMKWPFCTEKLYNPPYRSTMAQMLRTPTPWPGRSVTGTPRLNYTGPGQSLTTWRKNFSLCT